MFNNKYLDRDPSNIEQQQPQPQLQDNAIILKLNNGDVITAQSNVDDEGIIHIPENVWNHIVQEVQHPGQSFVNECYINVQDLNIVNNANVNANNEITRNDAYIVPSNKSGFNSFVVNVPPPQMNTLYNTIRQNGIYNLVDTDNNPDDIEIEPASNNQTKTLKLIKTNENENEMQEDTRDTPISLGQIVVNVPSTPSKLLISKIYFSDIDMLDQIYDEDTVSFSDDFTEIQEGSPNIPLPAGYSVFFYRKLSENGRNKIKICYNYNHTGQTQTLSAWDGYFYIINPAELPGTDDVALVTANNNLVFGTIKPINLVNRDLTTNLVLNGDLFDITG